MADTHFQPPGVELMAEVSSARWIEGVRRHAFGRVGAVIPPGFAAYARLFHPARRRDGGRVTWAEVAAWSGRTVHPLMAFGRLREPAPGYGNAKAPWHEEPVAGSLEREDIAALAGFLGKFTAPSDRCYFAVWEGYGHLRSGRRTAFADSVTASDGGEPATPAPPSRGMIAAERLHGVNRDYLLYKGRLSGVMSFGDWGGSFPNLWWPEDRAWCVATDIDLDSTYVGGTEFCIGALLGHRELEALPISPGASTYVTADTLNG